MSKPTTRQGKYIHPGLRLKRIVWAIRSAYPRPSEGIGGA